MTTQVVILRETWAKSIASDAGKALSFAVMIGLGVYLDSSAMQWVGGGLFFLAMMSRAMRKTADGRMSIDEAITHLEAMKAKEAGK